MTRPSARLRDPRVLMPAAAVALALVAGAALWMGSARPSPTEAPIVGTPIPEAVASPGAVPSGVRELAATSAPVPSAPPPATPTPTPDPAVWRFEGRVVDDEGTALTDVCVVIGPHGCQRVSPHTDERGVYFFDVPRIPTVAYDLYFEKPGYAVVWYPVKPDAPTVFNVVLRKVP